MKKFAVIVAGGSGVRMKSAIPKQFILLNDKPILLHTVSAFLTAFSDITIILVLPSSYIEYTRDLFAEFSIDDSLIFFTEGGDTRFQSVKNGLQLVPDDSIVFVHDAVRCLVTPALIKKCYEDAVAFNCSIPVIDARDSLRLITDIGSEVIERSKVKLVQTPQTFLAGLLKKTFEVTYKPFFTDEASVFQDAGYAIRLTEGDDTNIKITHPADLLLAAQILENR